MHLLYRIGHVMAHWDAHGIAGRPCLGTAVTPGTALRPLDLTASQAEVLRVLEEHQPLSLVAVGERLICETGSPSRLVNRLP